MNKKKYFFLHFSPNPCCTNVLKNDGNKIRIWAQNKNALSAFFFIAFFIYQLSKDLDRQDVAQTKK